MGGREKMGIGRGEGERKSGEVGPVINSNVVFENAYPIKC